MVHAIELVLVMQLRLGISLLLLQVVQIRV